MDRAEERNYLERKHAGWCVSKDVLADLVKRKTGKSAMAFDRVVEGYCNEVYFVRTDPPGAYVVRITRITRDGESGALEEAWCLRTCAEAGVPVPEVIGLESVEANGTALIVMLLTKTQGEPLLQMLGSLSPTDEAYAWRQMGTVLRKIHSVRVGGFYRRGPDGRSGFPGLRIDRQGLHGRQNGGEALLAAGWIR